MDNQQFTVTFLPSGKEVKASLGAKIINIAWELGLDVNAVCGGKGTCGKCRGKVVAGRVSNPTETEKARLSKEELAEDIILLCQREVLGDVTIKLEGQSIRLKDFVPGKGDISIITEIDPIVTKVFHQLSSPTIQDQVTDLERIIRDIPGNITFDLKVLPQIPVALRDANYGVTTTVFNDEIISIEPGNMTSQLYGIAFDIGTTSIAGYLVDLQKGEVLKSASSANKQRVHGADVIARINYTIENDDGLEEMKALVTKTLDEIIGQLLAETNVAAEHIFVITLIGNTVMSHLLLGVTPIGVVSSPFVPAFSRSISGTIDFLGIRNLPGNVRFVLLPNVAGYVGSDTVGVMLATKIYNKPGNWLAVDIGTNGEVVLSTEDKLLTCSTAAGPAFEGASISQGMRAEPGAILKVRIDADVQVEVMGGQEAKGIAGSGLLDAVSELVRVGVIRPNGRINRPKDCPADLPESIKNRIRETEKSLKFVLVEGKNEVALTQKDISELQLGKGAVRAGIEILLSKAGIKELDGVLLAGAFGSNLRPESLKGIGMLPDIDVSKIESVGNAAGTGAIMALLSQEQMKKAFELPKECQHIELSLEKEFHRQFARGMTFR